MFRLTIGAVFGWMLAKTLDKYSDKIDFFRSIGDQRMARFGRSQGFFSRGSAFASSALGGYPLNTSSVAAASSGEEGGGELGGG